MMYVGQRFSHPFRCSGPSVHQLKEVCRYVAVRQYMLEDILEKTPDERTKTLAPV